MARTIIRGGEVRKRTGLSDTQTWRLERDGKFPKRVQLGPMAVGWYEDEIDTWVHSRVRAGGRQPPLPKARRDRADATTTSELRAAIDRLPRDG